MLRTRVGYAGGTTASPTYASIGDHSEAIEIDFDPRVLSYEDLLAEFFASHNPCRASFSRQYRSAIFPRDDRQRRAVERAVRAVEAARGDALATDVEDFTGFTLAEDYHQKYRLRAEGAVLREYLALYPTSEAFLASTAVTRANAFAGGHGDAALVAEDLPRMGLSASAQEGLRRRVLR